jgi:hypothetical protein
MANRKWGPSICLDCQDAPSGSCPTCTVARYDLLFHKTKLVRPGAVLSQDLQNPEEGPSD